MTDPMLPRTPDDAGTDARTATGAVQRLRDTLALVRTDAREGPDARAAVSEPALQLAVERRQLWGDALAAARLLLAPEVWPHVPEEDRYALAHHGWRRWLPGPRQGVYLGPLRLGPDARVGVVLGDDARCWPAVGYCYDRTDWRGSRQVTELIPRCGRPSGFGEDVRGGGTLVIYRRPLSSGAPPDPALVEDRALGARAGAGRWARRERLRAHPVR